MERNGHALNAVHFRRGIMSKSSLLGQKFWYAFTGKNFSVSHRRHSGLLVHCRHNPAAFSISSLLISAGIRSISISIRSKAFAKKAGSVLRWSRHVIQASRAKQSATMDITAHQAVISTQVVSEILVRRFSRRHDVNQLNAILEAGDMDGRRVWHRVLEAVRELTSKAAPGEGVAVH